MKDIFRKKDAGTSALPSKSQFPRQQQQQLQYKQQERESRSAVPLEEMFQDQLHLNGSARQSTTHPSQQEDRSKGSAPAPKSTYEQVQRKHQPPQARPNQKKRQKQKHKTVPYFVLDLSSTGRSKALFTVPTLYAKAMCVNPVLCCGSIFDLEIDILSQRSHRHHQDRVENATISAEAAKETCFLSTEFYSPKPDETALEISKRLAIRIEGDGLGMSDGAGGFLAF